jgi:hypothetical protein
LRSQLSDTLAPLYPFPIVSTYTTPEILGRVDPQVGPQLTVAHPLYKFPQVKFCAAHEVVGVQTQLQGAHAHP